jgi:uncharacterized protein
MEKFQEINLRDVRLTDGFWAERLRMNASQALYHQYRKLDETGCLLNFKLAAGLAEGIREGFFFADSDAYKWLEAASLSLAVYPDESLQMLVDDFIRVLEKAQQPDGYLYTYNQIHFKKSRWGNLQVEHEMYCLGHLIEAGVTHARMSGETRLLAVARRAADLLVREFMEAGPEMTDGHEEIEIALIRLYQLTGEEKYLELARCFLDRRGNVRGYGGKIFAQLVRTGLRMKRRDDQRNRYLHDHPDRKAIHLPPRNAYHLPRWISLRLALNLLSGKFTQNHTPVENQTEPVGHAVRFVYLQTARAMLAGLDQDESSIHQQEDLWQRMLERRMYVTGGLGALPLVEGFGRDYELPDQGAYAETCAALGSIFWNHELALLTGQARYADLLEWQVYNAASVGISQDGCSYLYNNPLTNHGEIKRVEWYDCPCCPPNISRTWSALGRYTWNWKPGVIRLGQYISSEVIIPMKDPVRIELISKLPWRGQNRLEIHTQEPREFALEFRLPSWADGCSVRVNGSPVEPVILSGSTSSDQTACGYDPRLAGWARIARLWQNGDGIEIDLKMQVKLYRQDKRIPDCGGKVAVGYGPLLYCLERDGDPDANLDYTLLVDTIHPEYIPGLLGGVNILHTGTTSGQELSLIPYLVWGNRGPSAMTVFFRLSN